MPVTLTIPSGVRSGLTITIPEGQSVEIGRTSWLDNALRDDQFMSRLHMRVTCTETECVVLDLSSSNGTYVNGIRIHEALIKDGDQLRAGETCFIVAMTPGESVPPVFPGSEHLSALDVDPAAEDELLPTRLRTL